MRKPSPDPYVIFLHGLQFEKASEMLARSMSGEMDGNLHGTFIKPSFVLSAFTSEVYLKCLHVLDHNSLPSGRLHGLYELHHKLARSTRDIIAAEWERMMAWHPAWSEAFERSSGEKLERDFLKCLRMGSDAFVRYRYAYEGAENKAWLLGNLPDVLRITIISCRPEFNMAQHHFKHTPRTPPTSHSR